MDPRSPENLRLLEEWMETMQWLFQKTARFPKRLRHSLTNRIENLGLSVLEEVTSAAYSSRGQAKIQTIKRADDYLKRLRVMIRLCHEMELLSHAHYEEAARRLSEGGALLGGWLKQQRQVHFEFRS